MGLLCTYTRGRNNIKVERNSSRREYAIVVMECNMERKNFTKGTKARGSNTKITPPIPNVRRRPRANIHQPAQGFFFHWKMVWWVKGLMNHPILNVATNVGLLRIKVERHSCKHEYATVIKECSKERQSFKMGTLAQGWNTIITTPTPDVSRRPGENHHQAIQGMPPLENGLVC